MVLNKQKGNMYDWVTHTWNPIRGKCLHNCRYCYMHRYWKMMKNSEIRLDEKDLKIDLGKHNHIFVGSSTDMFAQNVPFKWINAVMRKTYAHPLNEYVFQTKNPLRFKDFTFGTDNMTIGITMESDIVHFPRKYVPPPGYMASVFASVKKINVKFVTIEPIMEFNSKRFLELIKQIKPSWVNIGADSGHNKLPEPSSAKINSLIRNLEWFTRVYKKSNLKRLL